ncbi:Ubiquitin carboxyl-terminal hydrolase MINDY-2, partial [Rhizophlyctis rosea]
MDNHLNTQPSTVSKDPSDAPPNPSTPSTDTTTHILTTISDTLTPQTDLNATAVHLADLRLDSPENPRESISARTVNEENRSILTLANDDTPTPLPMSTSASEPTIAEDVEPSDKSPRSSVTKVEVAAPSSSSPHASITFTNSDSHPDQPAQSSPQREEEPDQSYRLKPITFSSPTTGKSRRLKVITQNKNGPCPLLSLCNVLLLRGDISLPYDMENVTYERLVMALGDVLVRKTGERTSTNPQTPTSPSPDFAHNLSSTLDLIPHLQTGLDVNVCFSSPTAFELTPTLLIFDLFDIRLVHGWVVDPQDKETYRVVVEQAGSYNRVVERVVEMDVLGSKTSPSEADKKKGERVMEEGLICQEFLSSTASQLTYHGISLLSDLLRPNELAVLFRNNHFSTVFRHEDGRLLSLVTDLGYVEAEGVVWETVRGIDGDEEFLGSGFDIFVANSGGQGDEIVVEGGGGSGA